MKATVNIETKNFQAATNALIDSGASDNFISPYLVNRHSIPSYALKKPRIVRNVDGTQNSIGSVTEEARLQIEYNGICAALHFYIIDLGGDDMILGYPFLELTNPNINWSTGEFPGEVTARTLDAYEWTPERQKKHLEQMNERNFLASKEEGYDYDRHYIPNNERDVIHNPNYYARRVTVATELAIEEHCRHNKPYEYVDPAVQRYRQDKADGYQSAQQKLATWIAEEERRIIKEEEDRTFPWRHAEEVIDNWKEKIPKEYHRFAKVFSEIAAQRFPASKPYDHAIELTPDAPATLDCKVYPLAPKEQRALEDFLKEHIKKRYIRPSKSPYASPFFFIKKKDGKLRPVQDYRGVNKYTIRNRYPLPLIKELIVKLKNKTWFTKFDVRWGYNNVRIKEGDQWKAAFKTNKGLFEPTVMFFGLTNSPATFQTMMDDLFRDEIATGDITIYMDDILIATEGSLDVHKKHVAHTLSKLMANDLYLKPEKCAFHKHEVEYLGVIVGNGQVKMDPVKVKGLTDWPQPTKVKELRSFLGFGNYYKDFIPNYSQIARPLHDLTRKAQEWTWGLKQNAAFNALKTLFTSYPVLRNADQNKRFILTCDASAYAVGATLQQDFKDGRHPVAYFSKSLLPAERNYDIFDRELLAIIYAIKAFRYLLLGTPQKFLVQSDHNNLKYFRSPQKITARQARWMAFLEDYDFELEHLPGCTNTVADLLSRRSDLSEGVNINESQVVLPENLFSHKISVAKLHHARKIYLEDDLQTRRKILQEIHDTPTGGHPGISNTWHLVNRHYEGPRLRTFVEAYVKGCAKCQESKVRTTLKRAPLHHFDTPVEQGPFQYVSMDLITDLPKSGKYDSILTIVDQGCSKAAKFIPCNKTIDGEGVATLYFRHLFPWFGIPKRIISDRDPRFTSHFSRAVCKATGIQQNLSTAFHPRTDGQTERMNQWIETYLRSFVNGRQDNWSTLLPVAEFAHNTWKHQHTKYTPHELITGIVPSAKLIPLDDSTPSAHSRLSDLQKARSDAQQALSKRIKSPKDPPAFQINQKVWLDSRNLHTNVPSKKLAPRRYGPFTIQEKISPVAYRINLPAHMRIHNVFHIDLLTPFHATEVYGEAYPQPPPDLIEGEEEYEVEDIIADRTHRRIRQYLIKWKGYPSSENTWVNAKDLHAPELLKDYHDSKGRKIGTFQYIRTPRRSRENHQFNTT